MKVRRGKMLEWERKRGDTGGEEREKSEQGRKIQRT